VIEPSRAPVVVSIPGVAAYLHILRAITGSVAARVRMPVDAIEDLRLAVHEAASYLLSVTGGATLTLELLATEHDLRALLTADAVVAVWPPEGYESSLSRTVMAGLSDASMVRLSGSAPAIELRKRTLDP
jgi:hypothetical protein